MLTQEEFAKKARHKLTYMLSRREYSQKELLQKLVSDDIPVDIASDVLAQFSEKNLQSDLRFAESVVNSAYNKGKGPLHIQHKLQANDIEYALVSSQISDDNFDWFSLALKVRCKRFGNDIPNDWKVLQKQKRFLAQRGFEPAHIEAAFSSLE